MLSQQPSLNHDGCHSSCGRQLQRCRFCIQYIRTALPSYSMRRPEHRARPRLIILIVHQRCMRYGMAACPTPHKEKMDPFSAGYERQRVVEPFWASRLTILCGFAGAPLLPASFISCGKLLPVCIGMSPFSSSVGRPSLVGMSPTPSLVGVSPCFSCCASGNR